jgi:transposase
LQIQSSSRTIDGVIAKYKATQSLERKPGSGRPRKTDKITDRRIIRAVTKNCRVSAPEILKDLQLKDVSVNTVKRRIKEDGRFIST